MSELKITDFKMFKAPYELPDARGVIQAQIVGIKEQEKLFGSVYTFRLIKYALMFEAEKNRGKSPRRHKNTGLISRISCFKNG